MLFWWERCELLFRAKKVFPSKLSTPITSQKENAAVNLKQCIAKIKSACYNSCVTIKKVGCKRENVVSRSLPSPFTCHVVKFMHFVLKSFLNLEVVQQLSSELPKP